MQYNDNVFILTSNDYKKYFSVVRKKWASTDFTKYALIYNNNFPPKSAGVLFTFWVGGKSEKDGYVECFDKGLHGWIAKVTDKNGIRPAIWVKYK